MLCAAVGECVFCVQQEGMCICYVKSECKTLPPYPSSPLSLSLSLSLCVCVCVCVCVLVHCKGKKEIFFFEKAVRGRKMCVNVCVCVNYSFVLN